MHEIISSTQSAAVQTWETTLLARSNQTRALNMKVAIAGPGELAQHILPAFLAANHSVVVLTRSPKDWITSISSSIPQLIADYSNVSQLTRHFDEHKVECLISTLAIYDDTNISVHLNLLAACQASTTCKRFMPSEWSGNIMDVPDQPMFVPAHHGPVNEALRQQTDVEWTLICNGWFMEYVLPAGHPKRIFKDIGEAWVLDFTNKVMRVYGSGKQVVSLASAGDVGVALAKLVEAERWEEHTFVSGDHLSWNQLFEKMKARDGEWKMKSVSLAQSVERIIEAGKKGDEWDVLLGMFEIHGHSEGVTLPQEDVERQREKYFKGVEWKDVDTMLDEAGKA